MPAEEGYPEDLPSRLAEFYERSGYVETLSGKKASISIIGAVSPQGSDFSEPVTQNTKRFVRCFWALDKNLAYARHYAAINWMNSYSEYADDLSEWYNENVSPMFIQYRSEIVRILNEEDSLMEIVKLIGADVLPDNQRLVIETAKVIRVGFLQQNAMHDTDTYCSIQKQFKLMDIILYLYKECGKIISKAVPISQIVNTGLFEKISKIKFDLTDENSDIFDSIRKEIDEKLSLINIENFGEQNN